MRELVIYTVATFISLIILATVIVAVSNGSVRIDEFKQVCQQAKGTPAFNGKNWECIK